MSNLNLEWFQLSFDRQVVHVGQKISIFIYCSTKSRKMVVVKLWYFSTPLQNYSTLGVFQKLTAWIKMPTFIWNHVWIIKNTQKRYLSSKLNVDRFCPYFAYTAFRWTKLHGSFRVKTTWSEFQEPSQSAGRRGVAKLRTLYFKTVLL